MVKRAKVKKTFNTVEQNQKAIAKLSGDGEGKSKGKGKGKGTTKSNPWIEHVKKVAKEKGIPYGQAISVAKESYKK